MAGLNELKKSSLPKSISSFFAFSGWPCPVEFCFLAKLNPEPVLKSSSYIDFAVGLLATTGLDWVVGVGSTGINTDWNTVSDCLADVVSVCCAAPLSNRKGSDCNWGMGCAAVYCCCAGYSVFSAASASAASSILYRECAGAS